MVYFVEYNIFSTNSNDRRDQVSKIGRMVRALNHFMCSNSQIVAFSQWDDPSLRNSSKPGTNFLSIEHLSMIEPQYQVIICW